MISFNEKFENFADKLTWLLGTPYFFTAVTATLLGWTGLGLLFPDLFTNGSFIPAWAASNAWNFPINTGTSAAEMICEALIMASANRMERKNKELHLKILNIEIQNECILTHIEAIIERGRSEN